MINMAVFVTCMSLTKSGETAFQGMPVTVDEALHKPPMYLPSSGYQQTLPGKHLRH